MKAKPDTTAPQTIAHNTAASGAASIITLPAVSGERYVLDYIAWSYAGTPTSGNIEVNDATNSVILYELDITVGGPGHALFPERGLLCPTGASIVITLANGLQTKHLNIAYR